MPILKPVRAMQLNRSHPLARGLVGCWLFNEGTGGKVFDLSGNNNIGTLKNNTSWSSGQFGSVLNFDGNEDYVDFGTSSYLQCNILTITSWVYATKLRGTPLSHLVFSEHYGWNWDIANDEKFRFEVHTLGQGPVNFFSTSTILNGWHFIATTFDGSIARIYVDGILENSQAISGLIDYGPSPALYIGSRKDYLGTFDFKGKIDTPMIFNYALSAANVARLYRESFCMFEQQSSSAVLFVPTINLTAASSAQSTASAILRRIRRIKGSSAGAAEVKALLKIIGEILLAGSTGTSSAASGKLTLNYQGPWLKSPLKIERPWLTDALFNGMTANAFELGTVLTGGWFWMRLYGCSALYRGLSMEQIDFANILAVVEQGTGSFSPAEYIPHNNDSVYFYVVRRFNNCGHQERTLQAAVKATFDADGSLDKPQPNNIFAARADQIDGNKVQLTWFYCPLEQKSKSMCFKVYYDGGTGQIDYENSIGEIGYRGRKFYGYQSNTLPADRYLFAIRAEDADGVENGSLARLGIQLSTQNPDQINILNVKII